MKTNNWKIKLATVGMALGVGTLAQAEVPSGYYKGADSRVFIETLNSGDLTVSYGLVIRTSDEEAALFRIEEIEDGTQAWIRLSQVRAGLLGTNVNQEAAFSGTVAGDRLTLVPTSQIDGCAQELELKKSSGYSWLELPKNQIIFVGLGDNQVQVSASTLTGRFTLDARPYSGSFSLNEVIPRVASVRSVVLNPESPDGRSLDRNLTALMVLIKKESGFVGKSTVLKLIKISDGTSTCLDATSEMKQK